MKITAVRASWLRAVIPTERQHVSDFGRNDSFNTCLVEIDTDAGLTGLGEAKVGVGNLGNYAAVVETIQSELRPIIVGRDPRDITALWEAMYNGSRAHYVAREGRTFPIVGRRGVTVSAISGIDIALWDLLGKSLGQPVWRLLGGRFRDKVPAYASGGWAPVGAIGKQLRQYVERGHRAVKMRVGLQDTSVDDSAARVREVRRPGARGRDHVDAMARACATRSASRARSWTATGVAGGARVGRHVAGQEESRGHRHPDRLRENEQKRFASATSSPPVRRHPPDGWGHRRAASRHWHLCAGHHAWLTRPRT